MTAKLKKYVLPNLPYLLIFWLADKLAEAYRLTPGDVGRKIMGAVDGLAGLAVSPLPSFHLRDLLLDMPRPCAASCFTVCRPL